jgi:transcriptional regulator with XRE-family HTH domain
MKKTLKTRKISDGVKLLDRRYVRNDEEMKKLVEEEFEKLKIGQQIYDLRKESNLTQDELADMVGTTGSVISRLESAEYDGHSLKMLERIAVALGKKVSISIVDREDRMQNVPSATTRAAMAEADEIVRSGLAV